MRQTGPHTSGTFLTRRHRGIRWRLYCESPEEPVRYEEAQGNLYQRYDRSPTPYNYQSISPAFTELSNHSYQWVNRSPTPYDNHLISQVFSFSRYSRRSSNLYRPISPMVFGGSRSLNKRKLPLLLKEGSTSRFNIYVTSPIAWRGITISKLGPNETSCVHHNSAQPICRRPHRPPIHPY